MATTKHAMEKAMEEMLESWEQASFTFTPHKRTGVAVMVAPDHIRALIDDHVIKTAIMKGSAAIAAFEKRVTNWSARLHHMAAILESWLKVQSAWMHLDSVFSSEEAGNQFCAEVKVFKEADEQWRQIVENSTQNKQALVVTSQEMLLEKLQQVEQKLEYAQRGLNDCLEKKRSSFPRFYFLSSDDLVAILTATKDPNRLQEHIGKCFEGIHRVIVTSEKVVTAMEASKKEVVQLVHEVAPVENPAEADQWWEQMNCAMKNTIGKITTQATSAYPTKPRKDWALEWPGQVALAVNQIHWTAGVANAIEKQSLDKYLAKSTAELADLVTLMRSDLDKVARICIGALLVIDVHNRDLVTHLKQQGVKSTADFAWLAQLRYYMHDSSVSVQMINTTVAYGNEYLGNFPRLVITPLTDRCYRTLMSAIQLNLGGSPMGPAGTGKTETCKDLARALAKQCVVVNCSDQLDHKILGALFKGVTQSGAWAVFDEFNRIDIAVMSTAAQQIQILQRAVAEGRDTVLLEGTQINIDREFMLCLTMNPGYKGRTKLPDCLKSLFRPISMMVPDYCLIAEIMLFSEGFDTARTLARQIVCTFRLCSELLSRQDHYDFGMRALKSVLTCAGALKSKYPGEEEEVLLLQAITYTGAPKHVSQDTALFDSILKDVFPGVTLPQSNRQKLEAKIKEKLVKMNMQSTPWFVSKIVQIYDTMLVRHGLMAVGEAFGGKTTALKCLASVLTDLHEAGESDGSKVQMETIHPKAISEEELYGSFKRDSLEWFDGVLASQMREFSSSAPDDRKWAVCDGPVDAIWVEHLNAVLDDNKKLYLVNGEIIPLAKKMSMIFETQDLTVASPATVSRCGIIYMDPLELGWQPIVTSWIAKQLPDCASPQRETVKMLFDWLLPPALSYVTKSCRQLVKCHVIHLVSAMLKFLDCMIDDITAQKADDEPTAMVSRFLFSLVWSVASVIDVESRVRFDKFFRDLCETGHNGEFPRPKELHIPAVSLFPKEGSIYDYVFLKGDTTSWQKWAVLVNETSIGDETQVGRLLVDTVDSARQRFFLDRLTRRNVTVLFVGPTGTGKSAVTCDYLEKMPREQYGSAVVSLSAGISSKQLQELILSGLEKRAGNVFGPPPGKKHCVFVDDLNMPMKEVYGAQPPLELLRQHLDLGYWFNRKDKSKQHICDVIMLSAMGLPGGGRSEISGRLLRHFNVIGINNFDNTSIQSLFRPILEWHFEKGFDASVKQAATNIVAATTDIFEKARVNLLPTPSKPHYAFNIRDISGVVQGILMQQSDTFPSGVEGRAKLGRLWLHEVQRVFCDRLIDSNDRAAFSAHVTQVLGQHFKESAASLLRPQTKGDTSGQNRLNNVLFADVTPGTDCTCYDEITDLNIIRQTMEKSLEEYSEKSGASIDMVLFRDVIHHVLRLCRVLKQEGGHCWLVGQKGSGRHCVAKLSSFLTGCDVMEFEASLTNGPSDWREDMRRLMRRAGVDGQPVVFLLDCYKIKVESCLDDINVLLNAGDIPCLYEDEGKADIIEKMRTIAAAEGPSADTTPGGLYARFLRRVRRNLHVVLLSSPTGDAFRRRLRLFPSLVNCCTIDWFQDWGEDALALVAEKYLQDVDVPVKMRAGVASVCTAVHQSVTRLSEKYWSELKRKNYVTPASYLALMTSFRNLLQGKTKELQARKEKYAVGLERLQSQKGQVPSIVTEVSRDWTERVNKLSQCYERRVGDALLSACSLSYLGPFSLEYRQKALSDWQQLCIDRNIPVTLAFSLTEALSDPSETQAWENAGLPGDSFCIHNALMCTRARRWPLVIDPHGQATTWIRNMEKNNHLERVRQADTNYMRVLQNCIQFGNPCLMEDCSGELDPALEPLLQRRTFLQDNLEWIRLGDHVLQYNKDFKLYMTTRMNNPHFLPEVSVSVTVVNFSLTATSLADQLLGIAVAKEQPELEQRLSGVDMAVAAKRRQLGQAEDQILDILSASQGSIVEDKSLIERLSSSKMLSEDVKRNDNMAAMLKKQMDAIKYNLKHMALHCSQLFFTISNLSRIDNMYRYSLSWFINLYTASIESSERGADDYASAFANNFTYTLYQHVCRSLFEKDKLLFSFLLCTTMLKQQNRIDEAEWRFLVTEGTSLYMAVPNPAQNWLSDKSWADIVRLSYLPAFHGLLDDFRTKVYRWKAVYDSACPESEQLPGQWDGLTLFRKLLVLKCLRPDRIIHAARQYVAAEMGARYARPPEPDAELCFKDSASFTPLVFVYSLGMDPTATINTFAQQKGKKLQIVSLGQGQGPKAEQVIREAAVEGSWVLLRDCHLLPSWMPVLERLCDDVIGSWQCSAHGDFRLWLTSMPCECFPASVLENGIKMISEPQRGLKANLLRSFTAGLLSDPCFLETSKKPNVFKKLIFALCYFHAVVQERRSYGSIGCNIPYEFHQSDLDASIKEVQIFIDQYEEPCLDALRYLIGECCHGGLVADDKDRRLVVTLLGELFHFHVVADDACRLSESGLYFVPPSGSRDSYVEYVRTLPATTKPEAYGLHKNADIVKDKNETRQFLSTVLQSEQSLMDGDSQKELVTNLAMEILSKLPALFDLDECEGKYPRSTEDSMNVVLLHELGRFNALLSVITSSLEKLVKAINGMIVMSADLQQVYDALLIGQLPVTWSSKSYSSVNSLGGYVIDLVARVQYFTDWVRNGAPVVQWLSGYFFPQSLLSGVMQNHARKYRIPMYQIGFQFEVAECEGRVQNKPTDGVYIRGLFMEGARWCRKTRVIAESYSRILYDTMPAVWFRPGDKATFVEESTYKCPVYRTSERRGVLSTTGHSTNFVLMLDLPTDRSPSHWISRGVALLCQLDD